MSLLILLAVLPLLYYVLLPLLSFWREYRRQKQLASLVPGPPCLPIVGNLFNVDLSSEGMPAYMIKQATESARLGQDMWCIWIMQRCFIVPFSGKAIKAICDSSVEITKSRDYDLLEQWLGMGLLLKTGDEWRARRRLLTPTFHFSQLDSYITAMNRHAKACSCFLSRKNENRRAVFVDEILVDRVGPAHFDIYPLIKLCALDIICETTMGKELNAQHNPRQPYVTAVQRMVQMGVEVNARPILWSRLVRKLLGYEQEYEKHVNTARGFTQSVIEDRRVALERGEVEQNKRAFLDMLLLQSGENQLSIEDLKDEAETFMFEGHDTTASGLAWTIWCLACEPAHQEKAAQEVLSVFKEDRDREATRDDMNNMPYLDRCIKEAMRVFPPVPVVTRELQNDFESGGYTLPRGAIVSICPIAIHRNDKFDPDRFLPERSANRHAYDYIPFSAGPRNCIGQKFASYEEKVVMSWLLRRYRFETDKKLHDNPLVAEAILRPKNGCVVRVYSREQ